MNSDSSFDRPTMVNTPFTTPISHKRTQDWINSSTAPSPKVKYDQLVYLDDDGFATPTPCVNSGHELNPTPSTDAKSQVHTAQQPSIDWNVGQYLMANTKSKMKVHHAVTRLNTLIHRERVWNGRTRNGRVNCGIDASLFRAAIEWIWSVRCQPHYYPQRILINSAL